MATFSTHVLDAISGRSAAGVRIECAYLQPDGGRRPIFDTRCDAEGRVSAPVDATTGEDREAYEIVFHTGDYFDAQAYRPGSSRVMRTVVIRIAMPDQQARYHVPVIAGPHSYSVWWSA